MVIMVFIFLVYCECSGFELDDKELFMLFYSPNTKLMSSSVIFPEKSQEKTSSINFFFFSLNSLTGSNPLARFIGLVGSQKLLFLVYRKF